MDQDVGPAATLAVFDHYMKGLLMADPRNYYAQKTLKDGTPVTIRAIRKDDKERILDAFRALDREAVYRRFFSPKQDLTDVELEQVTDVDFRQVVALVATAQADGEEIVLGDGRYAADAVKGEKPECAELAFIIAEPYRGRGIASLLLRHLARIAQDADLSAFEADERHLDLVAEPSSAVIRCDLGEQDKFSGQFNAGSSAPTTAMCNVFFAARLSRRSALWTQFR